MGPMAGTNTVEALCSIKGDAYGFELAADLTESVYVCTVPCVMRLRGGRTLVCLEKSEGPFPVTQVSLCGMPECRFTRKQG